MRLLKNVILISVCIFFLAEVGLTSSEGQDQRPPAIRASTNLVVLDVVALDRQGRFVSSLKAGDFRIFEDGKEQVASSFELVGGDSFAAEMQSPTQQAPRTNQEAVRPAQPINVILLDSLNADMSDQSEGRRSMLALLKTLPAHRAFIVFSLTSRLRLIQSLTTDTEKLASTVDSVVSSKSRLLISADDKERNEAELLRLQEAGIPIARLRQFLADSDARSLDLRVQATCDALRLLARSLGKYPGRKNLIWISSAYPFTVEPDSRLLEPWSVQRNYEPMVKQTANVLSRSNVAVYPIDVRGLSPTGLPASTASIVGAREGQFSVDQRQRAIVDAQSTMEEIANQTGGQAYYNSNDLTNSISRAVINGSSYYVLGYTPTNKRMDGRFRRIKVEVNEKHTKLAYKRGYYAVEFSQATNDLLLTRELDLVMNRESPNSTELSIAAESSIGPDGAVAVRYTITGLSSIDAEGKPLDQVFFVSVLGWNKQGEPTIRHIQKVRLPATKQRQGQIDREGVSLSLQTNAKPGSRYIRIGVLDLSSGRIGTTEVVTLP